jgi:hypothetical protein
MVNDNSPWIPSNPSATNNDGVNIVGSESKEPMLVGEGSSDGVESAARALRTPASDEVWAIADAFRQATVGSEGFPHVCAAFRSLKLCFFQEGDTIETLNVMSNCDADQMSKYTFYVVEGDWMRRAWQFLAVGIRRPPFVDTPIMVSDDWRQQQVGSICNAQLFEDQTLASSEDVPLLDPSRPSDSSELLKRGVTVHSPLQKREKRLATSSGGHLLDHSVPPLSKKLRRNLQLGSDFVLLGPNAWLLVKEKFGYDLPVPRPCCRFPSSPLETNFKDSFVRPALAVRLYDDGDTPTSSLVPVPPTGRFAYEKYFATASPPRPKEVEDEVAGDDEFVPVFSPSPHKNVSDDESDDAKASAPSVGHISVNSNRERFNCSLSLLVPCLKERGSCR